MADEELFENIVTLTSDDGEQVDFEFIDLIEYKGKEYVVLVPVEEGYEDEGELVILKVEPIEGTEEESYTSIDDEALLETIYAIFRERFKNEFDFED